jgi:hypothetical protein
LTNKHKLSNDNNHDRIITAFIYSLGHAAAVAYNISSLVGFWAS